MSWNGFHPVVRSTNTIVKGCCPGGVISNDSPQCPTMTSAGALALVEARFLLRHHVALGAHLHVEHGEAGDHVGMTDGLAAFRDLQGECVRRSRPVR